MVVFVRVCRNLSLIDDLKEIKIQICLIKDEQSQLHQMPDLGSDHLLQSHVESGLKTQSISASENATRSSYSFAALKRTRQFCCFGKCTSYRQSSLECSFMAPFVWHLDFSSPNADNWRSNATCSFSKSFAISILIRICRFRATFRRQ